MMSIENTEPEKNATITESPTNTSTNTTEATKEEIPTVIQYVVKENPENYNLKDFHSNVYDLVYPNEDKDSILYGGMLFAVLLAIIFTIKFSMSIIKQISFFRIPAYKMIPVYSFLRDLTILMLVLSVLIGMAHYHKLDFIHSNIVTILYGFYIFILLWITISIILLYTSYLQLRRFFEFETISKDISKLNELKRFYEDLWMENQQIHHLVKDQIQFQLMRQSFIYPVELPILTEWFLKREFDFSSYLGYCISDFLGDIVGFINFKMGVILIILGLAFKLLKEIDNEKTQNVMFYTTPLITLVILFIVRWHLRSIYSYLVPEVSKPELINFQVDIDIIDPFDHYDNLQVPPYLEDTENNHGEDESAPRDSSDKDSGTDEDDSEFEITKKPKDTPKNSGINESKMIKDSAVAFVENEKKTNNRWMFKSGKRCWWWIKQNRHQRLFWWGRFGLFIWQFLIQAWFLTNLIWLTALIAGKGKDRFYVFWWWRS